MALDLRRGADYSHARPTLAQLDANGISFCVRYLLDQARDGGKALRGSEAAQLTAWGRKLVCNFEYMTGAMALGSPQGAADARIALGECKTLKVPTGRPVYFSDDTGSTPVAAVQAYLRGAAGVLGPAGYEVGVYGGLRTVTAAYDAGFRWLWQTYAWSGGTWHPNATIRQILNGAFIGWDGDLDVAQADDFGQWDTVGWIPGGGDMPLTPADVSAVAAAVWEQTITNQAFDTPGKDHSTHEAIVAALNTTNRLVSVAADVDTLALKLDALASTVANLSLSLSAADKAEIVAALAAVASGPRTGKFTFDAPAAH